MIAKSENKQNRQFLKEVQMESKYMKKRASSLAIKEM
jgi:hypothetical protein